jgi:predicted transposase YbfD/YdcC
MSTPRSARLQDHFATLTDPRRRKVVYPLIHIVTIAVGAVIAGADDFVSIAGWAREERHWLARFLDLSAGIPSYDRFHAMLAALKPAEFEKCLLSGITALLEVTAAQVVASDGKTLRRSLDGAAGKSAIPMVSAWATANHLTLGQVVVDAKSNEITAIPNLLRLLELSGCLVTIDAMGCQTEIVQEVLAAGADFVLAVKANQPTLHDGIEAFFLDRLGDDFARVKVSCHETKERGHGRQEHRSYFVCEAPYDLPDRSRWPKLAAISETVRGGKSCDEVRYYILIPFIQYEEIGDGVLR